MFSVFLSVNIKMKKRCCRLPAAKALHKLCRILFSYYTALCLYKSMECVMKWRILKLRVDQVIGIESELVELLLPVPDEKGDTGHL